MEPATHQLRLGNQLMFIVYRILIALIYAKSLYSQGDYVRCFELLQHEFITFPSFTSLLYAYGKYVVLSQQAVIKQQ